MNTYWPISCFSTLFLIFLDISNGQGTTTVCLEPYELSFHETERNFVGAKTDCEALGGNLAKIYDANVTEALKGQVGAGKFYFIGAQSRGDQYKWVQDQSPLQYTNWKQAGTHFKGEPVCLAVGSGELFWFNVSCDVHNPYICQKKISLSIRNVTVSNGTRKFNCNITSLCRDVVPSWYDATGKISKSEASRIYQVMRNGSSELTFLHPLNIQESGKYTCKVTDGVRTSEKSIWEIGTAPIIHSATPVLCSRDVNVFWRASEATVNARHRIKVQQVNGRGLEIDETSSSTDLQETVITDLLDTTRYRIQIQAGDATTWNDHYVTEWLDVTTGGIPHPPTSPKSRLYTNYLGSICFVEWARPQIVGADIITYQVTAKGKAIQQNSSDDDIITVLCNSTGTFCAFHLPSNRDYNVTVKSVVCSKFSTPVLASGSCDTVDYETTGGNNTDSTEEDNWFDFDLVNFLIGAGGLLAFALIFLLFWCVLRCRRTNTSATLQTHKPEQDVGYEQIRGPSENDTKKAGKIASVAYSDVSTRID